MRKDLVEIAMIKLMIRRSTATAAAATDTTIIKSFAGILPIETTLKTRGSAAKRKEQTPAMPS